MVHTGVINLLLFIYLFLFRCVGVKSVRNLNTRVFLFPVLINRRKLIRALQIIVRADSTYFMRKYILQKTSGHISA